MGDFALIWDSGSADLSVLDDDLESDEGLRTAILLSLFTDRRALDDDPLPGDDDDRRGYWCDEFLEHSGDRFGSRLWLLERTKITADLLPRVKEYDLEALAWLVEDRVLERLDVEAELVGEHLYHAITIRRPDGDPVRFRFPHVWEGEAARPSTLVLPAIPVPPVPTLPVTSGLVSHVMGNEGLIVEAGVISEWTDQSGNGTDWLAVEGARPAVGALQNGLPVVEFAGSERFSQDPFLSPNSQPGEIFAVLRDDREATETQAHWSFSSIGVSVTDLLHFTDGDYYESFGQASRAEGTQFTAGEGFGIYNCSRASSALDINWNGAVVLAGRIQGSDWNTFKFWLGGVSDTWNFLGAFAEVIVYDRKLTTEERAEVNAYLDEKWGLGL